MFCLAGQDVFIYLKQVDKEYTSLTTVMYLHLRTNYWSTSGGIWKLHFLGNLPVLNPTSCTFHQ